MTEIEKIINSLNRISEVEGMIMPVLVKALTSTPILNGNEKFAGSAKNLYELWTNSFGDKFFKMGTFIRLGSEIESGFRHYYMFKKNYTNTQDLNSDSNVTQGIFQRLKGGNTLQELYKNELSINLEGIADFKKVKEFMAARHLYTHKSGLLDDKFINDWDTLTNMDLANTPDIIKLDYPNNDVYWFKPLDDIWTYQTASIKTFNRLPV